MTEVLAAIALGVPSTVVVTALAFAMGAVLGVPLALARRSGPAPLRWLAQALIDVLRGIPPVVWLFFIYFGLGNDVVRIEPLVAGTVGLGLIASAYLAEVYRGGLLAVHAGQQEAAEALGLSPGTTLARVVGPQAVRVALPGAATYLIGLLKDSSIVSTIGVTEMVFRANAVSRSTGDGLMPFLVAAALYIVLSAPLAWASRSLDARLRRRVAR